MRKFFFKLHLWLGLASGIVVFIVCITGCLYVFKDEITAISKPWLKVESQERATLKPTELTAIVAKAVSNSQPSAITYGEKTDAVWVDLNENQRGTLNTVYLNPYTGEILHISKTELDEFNFFDFLLKGHTTLWLPRSVGQPIVGYGVLLFFITLLTGLFIWFPKRWNRKTLKNKFTFHRPFRVKRLVSDLHSILGLYLLIPLLSASFTGLIFAFDWFSSGVYSAISGGKELIQYEMPKSALFKNQSFENSVDIVYERITKEEPDAVQVYYALPKSDSDVIRVSVVHEKGSYYKQDNRFFDRDNAKELYGRGVYTGKYNEKSSAEKVIRMNLDIHEGRILGFFGKLLMCIASFVGASLPVTGVLLYLRKKR